MASERMIEVDLKSEILTFDGRVLEVFPDSEDASRFLARDLRIQELGPDRKGQITLMISYDRLGGGNAWKIPAESMPQYKELIAAMLEAGAQRK